MTKCTWLILINPSKRSLSGRLKSIECYRNTHQKKHMVETICPKFYKVSMAFLVRHLKDKWRACSIKNGYQGRKVCDNCIFFKSLSNSFLILGGIRTHNFVIFGQTPQPSCLGSRQEDSCFPTGFDLEGPVGRGCTGSQND